MKTTLHGQISTGTGRCLKARPVRRRNIVTVGGGTGQSCLLRGLRLYASAWRITSIVAMTDDGGSSGRLARECGAPTLGDLRNCLAALADPGSGMTRLLQHRFAERYGQLAGHSLGNLLLLGLIDLYGNDPGRGLAAAHHLVRACGEVHPCTLERVRLTAQMEDGATVVGETSICAYPAKIRRLAIEPDRPSCPEPVVAAIRRADALVLGPGSLYTSVLSCLLVPSLAQAIAAARVPIIYVCNIVPQPGETAGYTAADHVRALIQNARAAFPAVSDAPRYVLLNSPAITDQAGTEHLPVPADSACLRRMGWEPVMRRLQREASLPYHDPFLLARNVLSLLALHQDGLSANSHALSRKKQISAREVPNVGLKKG